MVQNCIKTNKCK